MSVIIDNFDISTEKERSKSFVDYEKNYSDFKHEIHQMSKIEESNMEVQDNNQEKLKN